ncbi:Tyrosine recombinase XerC [Planctomycetes bacterium Pan216]|uniref:Tyrosine recombinase XerC n=1 Tax=Kolteria novifilia TaxID=2527975 RepID=A0A518B404_9BACT|nr:Tyrosine recombinase XerC [Planctomycetes bacterium Pan216]
MPRKPKEQPIVGEYFTWYLRRKPSGVYFADGRINSKHHCGKPSLGTRDREEALRRLRALDKHMAIKFGIIEPEQSKKPKGVNIRRGWELYIERCERPELIDGVSKASVQRYRAVRDKHIDYCDKRGITDWVDVTKSVTKEYGSHLAKGKYAERTIYLELNLICSIVNWLVEEGHLPPESAFKLHLRKSQGSTTYCYTKQQVTRMVEFCNDHPDLVWMARVIAALATTGLRIGELAQLRWSDLDFEANTIRLTDERSQPQRKQTGQERRIKGKRDRALPMHPVFRSVAKGQRRHPDGYVFRGQKGGRLCNRRVLDVLKSKVIESLNSEFPTPPGEKGFAHGTVHGLRHYFCSEAYRNGAGDAELLEWLGHRDTEMTRLYRHLQTEDSQRKMKQINFLGSDGGEDCRDAVV